MAFVLVLFLVMMLAGCVSNESHDGPRDNDDGTETFDEEEGLTVDSRIDPPQWDVGDVFEQHLYFGSHDTSGTAITTIVVGDSGGCHEVATPNPEVARYHSQFDLPVLGCIGKANLETTSFDSDWGWMYDFPLTNGKEWGASALFMNWNREWPEPHEFTLTATFDESVETSGSPEPGYLITGHTPDGELLMEYNYVPSIGWFTDFRVYDVNGPDPGAFFFHMKTTGIAERYTGTYYQNDASWVLEDVFIAPFTLLEGTPEATFEVSTDADWLMGVVIPIACPGTTMVTLMSPEGDMETYDHEYDGEATACDEHIGSFPPPDSIYTVHYHAGPAVPGEWTIAGLPGGTGGYLAFLREVHENEHQLTESDLPPTQAEETE
jgi:hypothetical protein